MTISIFRKKKRRETLNKEKFAKLVIESTNSLYRVSKSILKNDADCNDAVSESITIAFQKLHTLKRDEFAKTWLTKILINECFRIKKIKNKIKVISNDDESYFDYLEQRQISNYETENDFYDLYEAMAILSDKQRIVITLYYYEEYSIKEIAQLLKISQGTVKSRLSIARQKLKDYLEEEYGYE